MCSKKTVFHYLTLIGLTMALALSSFVIFKHNILVFLHNIYVLIFKSFGIRENKCLEDTLLSLHIPVRKYLKLMLVCE